MSDLSEPLLVGDVHPANLLEGFILSTFIGALIVFCLFLAGRFAWRTIRGRRRRR